MSASRPAQVLALAAMGIALGLAIRFHSGGREAAAGPAAPAWTHVVEAGQDHISTAELAELMIQRPGGYLLVDLRLAADFAAFHLPGAVRMDLPALLGPAGTALLSAHRGREVVLCSSGMTHPAQAWVELRRRGWTNVRVLEDGLEGFKTQQLTPPSLRGPTTERRARAETPRFRALRDRVLGAPAGRYASDPEALVEPCVVSVAWLAAHLGEVAILDARSDAAAYRAGHLPGARQVPLATTRATVAGVGDQLRPPAELAALFGALGIGIEIPVVIHAGETLQDAAHLLLVLHSLGHRRLALLEGGLRAWVASGHPLSREIPRPAPARYEPRQLSEDLRVDIEAVVRAVEAGSPPILDARPDDEFRGERVREARPGRIPGSLHRFHGADHLLLAGGTFWRPRAELAEAYTELGLAPGQTVIVTCRTGHQASLTWFTLRFLLGYQDVRWYDGSWKEWSRRPDLPAESD